MNEVFADFYNGLAGINGEYGVVLFSVWVICFYI